MCLALSPVTGDLRAEVQLAETATYYLPGFTQRLERMKFGRLDGHELPAILAADGCRLALYTPDNNNCLFETALDPTSNSYSICFADVDHDLVPDILIGYYYNPGVLQADTVCKLEFYPGGLDYNAKDSFFYMAECPGGAPQPSPWSFVELTTLDIDGDNMEELFFSYDRYETMNIWEKVLQFTAGQTHLYSTFPETVEWERPVLLSQMEKICPSAGPDLFVTNRYEDIALLPGNVTANGWVEIISGGGDSLYSVGQIPQATCSGDSSLLISLYECLAVGDMNLSRSGPEILVRTYYEQVCYTAGEISDEFTDTDIRLYSVGSLPDIPLLWTDLSPSATSDIKYLPQSPGFFFSAEGSRVGQHSGLDGELCHFSEQLNADTLIWCDNPEITGGPLIAIRNQTLTVYRVDIWTDIEGVGLPEILPASFDLGAPYPNPFNASCAIEYSLPRKAHIQIGVYNVLGQKVKSVLDEVKPAGQHYITWDGTDQTGKPAATGVYLFKMKSGNFIDSKKILLLK